MSKVRPHSVLLTVLGVLTVAIVIFGLLMIVNAESGFATCTGTMAFGWLAPLLAASVIGGLAWILLAQEPRHEDPDAPESSPCPSCGHRVLGKWRLCPYCGVTLQPEGATEAGRTVSD